MTFLLLLFIPMLVAIGAFVFLKGITWKEFLLHLGIQVLVAGISAAVIYYQDTGDYETWNGWVTNKQQVRVSCSHSYQCNCRMVETCTGSGKNRSCSSSQVCDTCYEHSNDWDWDVYTSNQETINIDRVDRQGVHAPPRWVAVQIGEPTSQRHRYTSYIKAAPDTLFRHQGLREKYAGRIPNYPGNVYDYYRLNRLVTQGISVENLQAWNEGLSKINADLGSKKQVNMIVVLTDQPQEWYYALEEVWVGGKKNDAVLVIGLDQSTGKARWATVMAWTTAKLFEIKLRDSVMDLPAVTPEATLKVLRENVETYYKRKPMADFEYLRASIQPSGTELGIALFIGLLVAVGLTWLFEVHDVFGDEGRPFQRWSSKRKPTWGRGRDEELDRMMRDLRGGWSPFKKKFR